MKYSLSIPKEWTQVVENDTVSFVHKASGSTLRLETYAYDPNINNVTSESISTKIAADGKTFVSFTRKGDSSYEVTYHCFNCRNLIYCKNIIVMKIVMDDCGFFNLCDLLFFSINTNI